MKADEITDTTFAFRVSNRDKEVLKKELAALKTIANKSRPKGTRVINKNDILIEALTVGFENLRKKYRAK